MTGIAAHFSYEDCGDDYGLAVEGIYDPYNEEEFLVNAAVDTTVPPEE